MRHITSASLFVLACALAQPASAQLEDKPVPMDKAPFHIPVFANLVAEESPDPVYLQVGIPLLRDWIVQSRNEAIASGVRTIPSAVRSALSEFVPGEILDRVRWRVGGGGQLSLQQNSFYFADTSAVTLDYVIVFREQTDPLDNLELWVHELWHVIQFTEWGIEEFAARYLRDYEEIESDAARYRWQWVFREGVPAAQI